MYTETSSNMHILKVAINEDRTFANKMNEVQEHSWTTAIRPRRKENKPETGTIWTEDKSFNYLVSFCFSMFAYINKNVDIKLSVHYPFLE